MNNIVRVISIISVVLILITVGKTQASWEGGTRYQTLNSNLSVNKTSGSYGTNFQQTFDFYQPADDQATDRPLIILAHAGTFISGSKSDGYVEVMAKRFVQYG